MIRFILILLFSVVFSLGGAFLNNVGISYHMMYIYGFCVGFIMIPCIDYTLDKIYGKIYKGDDND